MFLRVIRLNPLFDNRHRIFAPICQTHNGLQTVEAEQKHIYQNS